MTRLCLLAAIILAIAAASVCHAEEGPVASWRFDTAGPQAKDLTGRGHDAAVQGGQIVTENGLTFLRMDGKARITVPSAPDLNLKRGFTIEARVRPTDLSDGRTIVFKENEYMIRVDWPKESGQLSFFPYVDGQWESRVSAPKPIEGVWLHIVAVWDGTQSLLWVNGLPHQIARHGDAAAPTDNPVHIGSALGYGGGFVGDIQYVKLYDRALTTGETIKAAYGVGEKPLSPESTATSFDFRGDILGWQGREGAQATASSKGLAVKGSLSSALALHDHLNSDISKKDYLAVRMTVDKGTRGTVVFATTQGAARVGFQTYADGRPHTYILEPWQHVGWGGKLLALGVAPAEVDNAQASIQYVRLTEEPAGEPEVRLQSVFTQSVLPRAGRPEKVVARVRNLGGPASGVKVSLRVPKGVALKSPATQTVASIGYRGQAEVSWTVQAAAPTAGALTAEIAGAGASQSAETTFQPALAVTKASYVPKPVPLDTGKYTIWTHYCPLWKHGTHTGWKAIEPYPERKPILGWYNEGTPEVADWHIKYWLEHGVSGVIYCWYRSNVNGPVQQSLGHAIHDGLLKARYLSMIKFGIMWENGCGQGIGSHDDLMNNVLPFWLDNYFTNPSYAKIDGKPVLYVWVPGNVTKQLGGSENVRKTFDEMRQKARERGLGGLYIVGCVGGADKESIARMATEGWDATSAYGNGWYPPKGTKTVGDFNCAPVEGFADQQEAIWKAKTEWNLLPDITAAMMGWDSRPWNETPFFWSDNTPAKFRNLCLRAKAVMDAKPTSGPEKTTAIFCCWNEFGEGHYIEPTRGYGFSYIDAIRDVFGASRKAHTDLAPEDVALGPYDSWYQAARSLAPLSDVTAATSWSGPGMAAWTGSMGLAGLQATQDGLVATSDTRDPALSAPPTKIRGNKFSTVVITMRVSKPGDAQLFWTTGSNPGASEPASVHVKTVADGQFHAYAFEVGKNEYWGGCITGLRFDPTDIEGTKIEIRSIELK